jgi:hypothetical protein
MKKEEFTINHILDIIGQIKLDDMSTNIWNIREKLLIKKHSIEHKGGQQIVENTPQIAELIAMHSRTLTV